MEFSCGDLVGRAGGKNNYTRVPKYLRRPLKTAQHSLTGLSLGHFLHKTYKHRLIYFMIHIQRENYLSLQPDKTDEDDDGWNDNYDGNDDNIDEIYDKNYKKHTNIMTFE